MTTPTVGSHSLSSVVMSITALLLFPIVCARLTGGFQIDKKQSDGAERHTCQAFSRPLKVVAGESLYLGVGLPPYANVEKVRRLARDMVGVNSNVFAQCPENADCSDIGRALFDGCRQVSGPSVDNGKASYSRYDCGFHNLTGNMERMVKLVVEYSVPGSGTSCEAVDWEAVDIRRGRFGVASTPPNATLILEPSMWSRDVAGVNSHAFSQCEWNRQCPIGSSWFNSACSPGDRERYKKIWPPLHEADGAYVFGACFENFSTGMARYSLVKFTYSAPYFSGPFPKEAPVRNISAMADVLGHFAAQVPAAGPPTKK